ncbi:replication initiation protein [Bacillus songklensis]|uniref:Replication initiation protein n=1 Tax=Bacillus songklensis TaxID=1069116 RepID=A0ABV8B4R5_9BACI
MQEVIKQEKKISPDHKVTKSNDLIETAYKLSLQETRIIHTLISMVEPDDEHFQVYKFTVKEFANMVGIKGNIYQYIREIITGLQEKTIPIKQDKSTLVVNWLASAEYFPGEGYVELEISSKLKPFLLNMKKRFTSYQLKYILQLSSFYSIRIYELLKQYQFLRHKTRTIPLETLREWIGLEPNTYKQYGHFKNRILLKAQEDINEVTDMKFEFQEVKSGRKVVAIEFRIIPKDHEEPTLLPAKEKVIEENSVVPVEEVSVKKWGEEQAALLRKLLKYNMEESTAASLLEQYEIERIKNALEYTEQRLQTKEIDNVPGYLLSAVKKGWAPKRRGVIRKEMIPSFMKETTEDEKLSSYLKRFELQENFEHYCLEVYELKKNLSMEKEDAAKIAASEVRNTLRMDIQKRKELGLPMRLFDDFQNDLLRRLYQEAILEHL